MAVNIVVLEGRLTKDIELKQTQSGVSYCNFSIAVDRNYKNGEERQTDFPNIKAWRSSAEFVAKYFRKGDGIAVIGRLESRNYTDQEGKSRTAFEVVAENFSFPLGKSNNQQQPQLTPVNEFAGFANPAMQEITPDLGDSDLPFQGGVWR